MSRRSCRPVPGSARDRRSRPANRNYRVAVSIQGTLGQFVQPSNGIVYAPSCFSPMLPYSRHEMPLQLSSHRRLSIPLPPPRRHHSSIATQSTPSTVERRCTRTTLRCATRPTVPRRVGLLWMRAALNSASAGKGLPCDSDAAVSGTQFRVATSLCRGRTECPQRAETGTVGTVASSGEQPRRRIAGRGSYWCIGEARTSLQVWSSGAGNGTAPVSVGRS
jgi:hypothetical protein